MPRVAYFVIVVARFQNVNQAKGSARQHLFGQGAVQIVLPRSGLMTTRWMEVCVHSVCVAPDEVG